MPSRSAKRPASNPSSISEPVSGLRSGFPIVLVRSADPTVVGLSMTRSIVYVCGAEYALGARPARPHAVRSLRDVIFAELRKPRAAGSSDRTYDSDNFG